MNEGRPVVSATNMTAAEGDSVAEERGHADDDEHGQA